ncbi:MAG: hypothetical protein ACRCV5_12425 [Afipia sp.]
MPRTATTKKPTQRTWPAVYRYSNSEIEQIALEIIKREKLVFISELTPLLPISHATFYNRGLDKSESIKEALAANSLNMKRGLRHRWYAGENATTQIALYKLLGTDEEADRLNGKPPQNNITNNQQVSTPAMSQRELALRFVVEAMAQGHTLEDATKALQAFTSDIVPEPVRNEVVGYLLGAGEPEPETT